MRIEVYTKSGVVFEYDVEGLEKAREHVYKIVTEGYRHTKEGSKDLQWFLPHTIDSVKVFQEENQNMQIQQDQLNPDNYFTHWIPLPLPPKGSKQ